MMRGADIAQVWSRDVVGDEQDCQRVVQLLKGLGLVAERAQSQVYHALSLCLSVLFDTRYWHAVA